MRKARWITLSAIGLMLSTASAAEETDPGEATDTHSPLPAEVISGDDFFDELQRAWRWQAPPADPTFVYTDRTIEPLDDFEFREGSSIERVARIRSVSLLTLAEIGESRLFFGVNDSEMIGIHFGAVTRDDSERHLEMARVPWLAKSDTDDATR